MLEDTIKNNLLYCYLLGTLSEQQQEQIEEEYFSQPERRQELWAIFDEITERFLQRELDPQDAQKFALQLQTKPYLRARAERLQSLYHLLPATAQQDNVTARLISERRNTSFTKWFAIPALRWGGLATCALLLGIGGYLLSRKAKDPVSEIVQVQPTVVTSNIPSVMPIAATPTAQSSVVLPIKPKTNPSPTTLQRSEVAAFYILQEGTRTSGEATKLAITEQTQILALHFEVQAPFQSSYNGLAKMSNGKAFKSFANLKVHQQNNLAFVTVQLAVTEISGASFTVQINNTSSDKEAQPLVLQRFYLEK